MSWRPTPKVMAPLAVLALGVLGAVTIVATGPEVQTRPAERPLPLVRVIEVAPGAVDLPVVTHGSVVPRTESDLIAEVSGTIQWVAPSLVSGGFFEKGDPLLRIDPLDYEVALERARAQLARAQSEDLRARRERDRRRELAERDFASAAQLDDATNARQSAAAALREARAAVEQAERDLARTRIAAPYTGRVREETVDVGQFIARGARIARLYAIDHAEVRLPVSDEEIRYLDLPLWYRDEIPKEEGPEVRLRAQFAGEEHTWTGRVVRTEGEIDPTSRMVHVIARVDDPYGRRSRDDRPPLVVGLFVEARITGRRVENAFVVPRAAMRGANRVLVVDDTGQLRFRDVSVLRSSRTEVVLAGGLSAGERVVVSPLEAATEGMRVRVLEDAAIEPAPAGASS